MTQWKTHRRLGDWFRQWRSPLRKFLIVRGAVRTADIDDVAQEVFMRLLRYQRTELVEHPQAYLFKVASNVAAEWAIRARHRFPHEAKWLDELTAADQPEAAVAHDAVQAEIERALNTLSPAQREILKLHFAEELGHAEIAERIGSSQRSVKRSLMKSYARLRVELNTEIVGGQPHGRD